MAKKNCEYDDETVNLGYTEFWTAQVVVNGSKNLSLPRMRGELLWFLQSFFIVGMFVRLYCRIS